MNTTFFLTVSCEEGQVSEAERLLEECHLHLSALENCLSEFKDQSDVRKLNQSLVETRVPISLATLELLERSSKFSIWSDHAFNPAFRSKNALSLEQNFAWSRPDQTAWKRQEDAHLSFGAIGKGYALDQVHECLKKAGFFNHRLIAGGSSLIFSGAENQEVPWKLSLALRKVDGRDQGWEFECLQTPLFVGVSGNQHQGEHITRVNPLSERVQVQTLLATSDSASNADALSTALYANPLLIEKGLEGAFFLIDNQEKVYFNPRFSQQFRELK